jgi:dTDP-L-rhamnose 4-epimerase
VLAREIRRRTGVALHDLGPMRAAFREPLVGLALADRRSGWPLEMVLAAAAAGWRIEEVPVPYLARQGRSKVTGTVRGTLTAIHDLRVQLARTDLAADSGARPRSVTPQEGRR